MPDIFEQDFRNAAPSHKLYIDDPIIMAIVQRAGPAALARLAGAYRAGVLDFGGAGGVPRILQEYMNTGKYVASGPTAAANDPRATVAVNSLMKPDQLDSQVESILNRNLPGYQGQALTNQRFTGKLYLDNNILRAYLDRYGQQGLFRLNELNRGGFLNNQSSAFTTYLQTGGLPSLLGYTPAARQDERVQIFNQPASEIYNYALRLSQRGYPGYGGWANREVGGMPPPPVIDTEDNAFTLLKKYMADLGFSNMDQFAKDFIKSGKPMELLEMELRETPQFAERFPAIVALEKAKKANPQANLVIPTPGDYMEYERQAAALLASAGLFNLATRDNVNRWITNQRSIVELSEIIQDGYEAVSNAPTQVREAFQAYYGPAGDAALASYFLNTNQTAEQIRQDVAAAQVGGAARLNQIGIGRDLSERISDLGISFQEALQGFGNVRQQDALLRGTYSQNAFGQGTAVEAQFGMNPTALNDLQRRLNERIAAFGGGGRASGSGNTVALGSAV